MPIEALSAVTHHEIPVSSAATEPDSSGLLSMAPPVNARPVDLLWISPPCASFSPAVRSRNGEKTNG